MAPVRSGPVLFSSASATLRNVSRRRAADLLDQLRRVAGIVPLEDLEHRLRVLQRGILERLSTDQFADARGKTLGILARLVWLRTRRAWL